MFFVLFANLILNLPTLILEDRICLQNSPVEGSGRGGRVCFDYLLPADLHSERILCIITTCPPAACMPSLTNCVTL